MTTWAKMSKTKRCWVVYHVVRKLEPNACVASIQNEIRHTFGTEVRVDWLIKRLENFSTIPDRNSLRVVLRQELMIKDTKVVRHWRTNRDINIETSV